MNRKHFKLLEIARAGLFLLLFCMAGCKSKSKTENPTDTFTSGTIHITVEEEIEVYEKSFPGSRIIAEYKTEANCFKDLFSDTSNRMIIVTRGLTREEDQYFKDRLNYSPRWEEVASDAITVIVNSASKDTLFTVARLKKQLTGLSNRDQTIVFDGLNATSTVRFILDSILHGQKFDTSVVRAVKSSREVINYVSNNSNAVGFVGISWIGNPEDTAQVKLLRKVKIAWVACDACTDSPYVKPMQVSILSKRYPLVRGLYYILKENYSGLGTGFTSFMKYERGQLIFKRAYLGTMMGFDVRNVKINEKL
jgi:phosphate transport system substrate-binding protein